MHGAQLQHEPETAPVGHQQTVAGSAVLAFGIDVDMAQIRVVVQDWKVIRVHQGVDLRVGKMLSQRAKNRSGDDQVAYVVVPYDKNFHPRKSG